MLQNEIRMQVAEITTINSFTKLVLLMFRRTWRHIEAVYKALSYGSITAEHATAALLPTGRLARDQIQATIRE
jgi:hypothetical protein